MSETITYWRMASQGLTWSANDLSGNGAARHPGRWNSRGQPVLYSSSSIALACLKTVVNLAGDEPLLFQRQLVRITLPSQHWRERMRFLPEDRGAWDLPPNPADAEEWLSTTRAWGDTWLLSGESLIAEVPSVIVPEESNLLLNPRHPAHAEVVAELVRPGRSPWELEWRWKWCRSRQGSFSWTPQHWVRVPAFSLAQTPITQCQWRQVARWQPAAGDPPWQRERNPNPSIFQRGRPEDDRRPVENVSWFDALPSHLFAHGF